MKIDILTLFPEMFNGFINSSLLGKAIQKNIVEISTINFREFAMNKHKSVDDAPYGGGGGMILRVEPIFDAIEYLIKDMDYIDEKNKLINQKTRIILLCPQGETFSQQKALELSDENHLIFICGHYEGFDERIREHLVTDEISIGDYVLMGGEAPAMVIIDSVVRLLPGVLGNNNSAQQDSFSSGLIEYPHYTRPPEFHSWKVPEILLSGHHKKIEKWRKEQSIIRTYTKRPDLLAKQQYPEFEKNRLQQLLDIINQNNNT